MSGPGPAPARLTRRRLLTAALGLAGLAGLGAAAGCARVPVSGRVRFATPGVGGENPLPVLVLPAQPEASDSPQQIVNGFLDAMRSYDPGWQTARAFLTSEQQTAWTPSGVTVYDDSKPVVVGGTADDLRFSAPQEARISDSGRWTSSPPGVTLELDFRLVREHGEWRISAPPKAALMSGFDVSREFRPYDLYFYDPTFTILVPDRVHQPVRMPVEPLLVEGLRGGPAKWLAPAVRTAFPDFNHPTQPTVVVDGDIASVDLDPRVTSLSDTQLEQLSAQLWWTLNQVGIQAVTITANQSPVRVPGADQNGAAWKRYDPEPTAPQTGYAIAKGRLVRLDQQGAAHPLPGPLGRGRPAVRSCAVSLSSGETVVAVSADGHAAYLRGSAETAPTALVTGAADLRCTSYDRYGLIWLVDMTSDGARILVVRPGERARAVPVDGVTGHDVQAFAISRDGIRLATIVGSGTKSQLVVARVDRGPTFGVGGSHTVSTGLTGLVDLTWDDPQTLVVIGERAEGTAEPYLVSIDGAAVNGISTTQTPTTVVAGPLVLGSRQLIVGTGTGKLLRQTETGGWEVVAAATNPCYPG